MPNFSPVTLQGVSTPRIFQPVTNAGGLASFCADAGVANLSLAPLMTVSLARPSKTSRLSKSRVRISYPVPVITPDGQVTTVKSHDNWVDITFASSEKAANGERTELIALLLSALQDPTLIEVIEQNRNFY